MFRHFKFLLDNLLSEFLKKYCTHIHFLRKGLEFVNNILYNKNSRNSRKVKKQTMKLITFPRMNFTSQVEIYI